MLLRTRITLIVALGFLALMGTFWGATIVRDRLEEARTSDIAISGQSALWREIVTVQVAELDQRLGRIVDSSPVRLALSLNDRAGILAALSDLGVGSNSALSFEVVAGDREILFSAGLAAGRSILDAGSLDRAQAGERIGGLRSISADQVMVVATRVVTLQNAGRAVVVLGRDVSSAVQRFSASTQSAATLLTLRDRIAATTDAALWARAAPVVAPRQALYERIELAPLTYSVVNVPVEDINGGIIGGLVSLKDTTAAWAAQGMLRNWAIGLGILLLVIGVIGVNAFLWYSFRPLEDAIDVLQALSRGDTSVTLERTGKDEIGRIAEAVVGLRGNVQALAESRRQRDRVRRRQETVISRELKALADALDASDREEVLALLQSGEQQDNDDELRRVARVLHDLSRRIVEQYTRLSAMVVELREALITKTKLAGLQQELEIARQVQLAILPKEFSPDPRVTVDGSMTPAREVGGDFYDYFLIDKSTLGFVVADVSGKGVPAALFMAISRTLLRSTALFERSPAGCVRRLNDLLAVENEQMLFVTLFYGVLDLETGRLSFVNAGHNLPYRITRDGALSTLPSTAGMAVAVLEGFIYVEHEMQLAPGDTLFLFTDGVTEAFDIDDEPYGEGRLESLLSQGVNTGHVPEVAERVLASIHAFERGAPQADDITCLTLRYFGGSGSRAVY
ncbi:SpoIIE family protein phosphatase [Roseixanthobacter glucoisosaccharinicivorans]|uniref:SpoIIE family protein phosphatase n=1 Tax=Roseixanthobacter glucoisosaccharinicivorans TaxID=3119923 RepID=UPI003726C608